ncbi:cobalamin biosynthesis protein CobW [Synechococcus sp. PCC 6312]|uniref:cobalamin biosynthesis protein CobW n=1 Tax=Synechococcus sp. (strain ATCC 27167 / PCC 6312) TaxID=195253 RepID=UPI00029EEC5D|nr:cobalamin biosynthesis protein CobW [Synechococcus sp. PCC 6312]AFY59392.1 cobalamin biosynthesis protein CobW [Synechococcus sp. PCC 6312]
MASKIPVTIITGFLGSGKTTLIRHLLQNNQGRRIAVLVNEFGEIGIDGDLLRACTPETCEDSKIWELTNGCLCCTVQEEFLPTMLQLLKRRDQLDHILIETSGLALPKPLVTAFRWPEIRQGATVDGVVTVVDCFAVAAGQFAPDLAAIAAQRQADESLDHDTPLGELFEDQLACSDLVILNKTDQVDANTQARVMVELKQELSPRVKILSTHQAQVSLELVLGFNAAVEDDLDARPSHHDLEEDHDHDEDINSAHIIQDQEFQPDILRQRLEALLQTEEIYRIKGFVAVPEKPMRLVMQGVGQRLDYFYDRLWQPEEPRQTRLVFIGRNLDPERLMMHLIS